MLYLFKIIGINLKLETGQLHMFGKNYTITAVKNTLRKRFEDKFFHEIHNSPKLGPYNCIKEKFATERYLSEISYYNIDQLLKSFEFQRKEDGHLYPVNSKRYCPLCLMNHIGDGKHYILHCTNINFIEPQKSFLRELYRINTNNSLINSSPKGITQWMKNWWRKWVRLANFYIWF